MENRFTLLKTEKGARLGRFETVHGEVLTPAFQNVATSAAIKGGLDAFDLKKVGCQIALCNTYHLHLRPGDEVIKNLGGIRKFMNWKGPVLTDSGGFQVFSLATLRKIDEEGVSFRSHIDGRAVFMGPEESMRIQSNLGSTVAMAFDECVANPSPRDYVEASAERTYRWLVRCKAALESYSREKGAVNPDQMLFGINQGGTYDDIRIEHMKKIAALDLPGYAIGGLAVGEKAEEMYRIIEAVEPYMPKDRPRYLMGVGTPVNIIEAVARGVDLFDCVMPSRNARHGHIFTSEGVKNIKNEKYKTDKGPLDKNCGCYACRRHSAAYIRHLLVCEEMEGYRLLVTHNLHFYNKLMEDIRAAIAGGRFLEFYEEKIPVLGRRI